jgi:hypothetical protein
VGDTQQQQQQQQQENVERSGTQGMLIQQQQQQQLKRSFSDPHGLSVLLSGDSNDSSNLAIRSSANSQQQQAKQQIAAAAAATASAAAASQAPLMLEIPTVAVRRCMLQTSTEKFSVNSGHSQVQVEVRSIGLYRFKGVHEPVHMVAVSSQRLAGRWFPEAAPSCKVSSLCDVKSKFG